jgi:hypothetical protein
MNRWWLAAVAPALALLVVGSPAGAAEKSSSAQGTAVTGPCAVAEKSCAAAEKCTTAEKTEARPTHVITETAVFAMEEVPAFSEQHAVVVAFAVPGTARTIRYSYPRAPYIVAHNVPSREVKAYPKFQSKRPLYGSMTLDNDSRDSKSARTFYFVLDESGETKPAAAENKTETSAKNGSQKGPAGAKKKAAAPPNPYSSEGAQAALGLDSRKLPHYDRLYFDCNGDLDLTNDGIIKLAGKPPFEDMPGSMASGFFEELKLTLDLGPALGRRTLVLLPHLLTTGPDMALIQFLPKTVREGKVRLGGEEYVAHLSPARAVSARFDSPQMQLDFSSAGDHQPARALSGPLGMMRSIDGQFVSFSATPLGDKLTMTPYRGDLGVLEVGSGGRAITELGIAGLITSRAGTMVPLEPMKFPPSAMPRRYRLPVGDYTLTAFMALQGRLCFQGRAAANRTAGPGKPAAASASYPIQIRKDKPFRLEFSGKPEVQFMAPDKERSFSPGEDIRIAAMLAEPWQGIQITGLFDAAKTKDGTPPARLDPTIAIRNSQGKVVSTGKMPFG